MKFFLILAIFLFIFGCIPKQESTIINSNLNELIEEPIYILQGSVVLKPSHSRRIELKKDTSWTQVGSIEYGDVYRTKDQVVQVNSFHVYEADIVVKDSYVIGYYLPVSGGFVKAKKSVKILFLKK